MNEHGDHVLRLASGLGDCRARSPVAIKTILKRHLELDGWYCSPRFKVPSRGTDDGYRGILDLICWPPPLDNPRAPGAPRNPDIRNRPPPVLIEIDKKRVLHKTRAKLASFQYPASARIIILTRAATCDPLPGIDTILCLGA